MSRILMYCPLTPESPRIHPRTLESILGVLWSGQIDLVFGKWDHKRSDSRECIYDEITDKYENARRLALEGSYDALFTVEADMILPDLALERLSRVDADIAYGLYVSRHDPHRWLAFSRLNETSGTSMSDEQPGLCKEAFGQVIESAGVGLGCTLIWWHVLKKIRFRRNRGYFANDWYLSVDAQKAGFTQKHDMGVVCGHIQGDKVLYPDPEANKMVRREAV
jgi:hypothetical protein